MHGASWLVVILSAVLCCSIQGSGKEDDNIYLNTPGLVCKYGHPIEKYEVETEDGHILSMLRIPCGKKSPLNDGKRKPVVRLQHGLMNRTDDLIIIGPDRAFEMHGASLLADILSAALCSRADDVSEVGGGKGSAADLKSRGNAVSDMDLVRCLLGQGAKDDVSKVAVDKAIALALETMGGADVDVDFEQGLPALGRKDEDINLNTPGLVSKYGYPVEKHEVVTEDGYILTMFRIPYGKKSPLKDGERKPAVLLQHGLMNSADDWVIIGPERAFAYILADAGYDVWLGNIRGNWYSQKHRYYSKRGYKFWQFSWHEHGIYDMPAQIDHVLKSTGHKQIYYIGHSMGTTMFYLGMSLKTEYNQKIRAMFSLAPIAYMNHMKSPLLQFLAPLTPLSQATLKLMGATKFTPSPELIKLIQPKICKEEAVTEKMCTNLVFFICGFDDEQVIHEKLEAISAHIPAGSSVKQFIHYAQGIHKGHFRQYDHGFLKNYYLYGHITPPDYNLKKVTAPVYLFYGANDWLAGQKDIDRLHKQLGNSKLKHKIPFPKFNHLDFTYGKDARDLVYKPVIDLMNSYEKGKL